MPDLIDPQYLKEWEADCLHWRGKVLTGKFSHWCNDWDGLPIDETCKEWICACFPLMRPNAITGGE